MLYSIFILWIIYTAQGKKRKVLSQQFLKWPSVTLRVVCYCDSFFAPNSRLLVASKYKGKHIQTEKNYMIHILCRQTTPREKTKIYGMEAHACL